MKGGANLTWSEKYKNDAMFHEVLMHFFLSKGTSNLIAKGRSGLVFGLAAPDDMEDRFFPLKDHLGNAVRKVILKLGCIHDTSKKWVLNADLSIMSETKTEFDEEFEKQVVVMIVQQKNAVSPFVQCRFFMKFCHGIHFLGNTYCHD